MGSRGYTMEPQNQMQVSSRLSTDHYQHDPFDTESSDEDDDDIPAYKLPSVSPSKRFTVSSTCSLANQAKRSLPDAVPGGIVLYPGSKRPRNGYNMTPMSRENLPSVASNSPRRPVATIEAPSHTRRPSLSSEDDVFEGLVSSVNNAFHHRQTRQTMEQQHKYARKPTSHQLNGVRAEELEEYAVNIDDKNCGLPQTIPTSLNPPDSDNLSGGDENAKHAEPDKEHPGVHTRVDTVSLPTDDVWSVPHSPGEPSQNQPMKKKRGRPPKFLKVASVAELLPNSEPYIGKRKQGRPRKSYPRLRNETDKDYITRIARLQKKAVPYVPELDLYVPGQSSLARNSADVLKQSGQNSDVQASACVSGSFQSREPHGLVQPCHQTASNPEIHQLSQKVDNQLKVEPEKDALRSENHAELGIRNGSRNDNLAQDDPAECDGDGFTDSATLSDSIGGFYTDPESDESLRQSHEDSFKRDVDLFNARQPRYAKDDEVFEGPSDDDVSAIHLDYQPIRQLCKLLGNKAWAGLRGHWQWRYFDYDGAETTSARALLRVLAKLERLYQKTPKAPELKQQNRFLKEHSNMLGYYFHKIKILVEHIRTRRLWIPEPNEAIHNIDSRKRKRMTQDLVLYVIPMLTHVLSSVWGLGGETWSETSFTGPAVELLKRTLGWIMRLHRRLLRELELERCSLEEEPEKQDALYRLNVKREELAPLLDDISRVIAAAPDQLVEAEIRAKKELQRRQQQLRREQQLKTEQVAAEQARQAAIAERKKRSLLSVHGTITASSRPSPSLTLGSTEWSIEEQRLLFLRIQASFPVCPDLNTLRWELNKTAAQTVAMTEHILGKMLTKVLIGYSAEEQTAELRRIMRSSGVTGL